MDNEKVSALLAQLKTEAQKTGYRLNPDEEFVRDLVAGLEKNKERYGVLACPCRLYSGSKESNLDIICPCDYRDDDISEYGACFCALYVGVDYNSSKQIPDRRKAVQAKKAAQPKTTASAVKKQDYTVWRCDSCGYLCANHHPPEKCPICGADKQRFHEFL